MQLSEMMQERGAVNLTDSHDPVLSIPVPLAIGKEQIKKAKQRLEKYKSGKSNLESKIVNNERWWKMRHWDQLRNESNIGDPKPASGWLFNTIISKHADFMDSFPTADVLPREAGDQEQANMLSAIIPCILEQNDFEHEYSEEAWYKLKHGTGCYQVTWDPSKLSGLGDVSVKQIDLLSLFWEPGVTDIQQSRDVFHIELVDNDKLVEMYPQLKGKLKSGDDGTMKKYILDDTVDCSDKSLVIDWYYKKIRNGKQTLQFCKFVNEEVLFSTENETKPKTRPEANGVYDQNGMPVIGQDGKPVVEWTEKVVQESLADTGWYADGQYPFVFDVLFPESGLPIGFGFVDVCKNDQASIDLMRNSFEKNVLFNQQPRHFVKTDGGINAEEYNDPNASLVHVDGNLSEDSIRSIEQSTIPTNSLNYMEGVIREMKETAGNRDATTGGTTSGVTAASAIAAMQESAGKTSRDMIKGTYRAYRQVVNMVIERIRQFYDTQRMFRIEGDAGQYQFVQFDNSGIKPQYQGEDFGVDMGYRLPVFDLIIKAEKENAYTQLSQNELALQFYNSGFFNPQQVDQVLACLNMMNFQGKSQVIQTIQNNGGMYQQMLQMQSQMLQMAQLLDAANRQLGNPTNLSEQMAAGINQRIGSFNMPGATATPVTEGRTPMKEAATTANAREQANAATSPR